MGVADDIKMTRQRMRLRHFAWLLAAMILTISDAAAQETTLKIDPAKSSIQFTLDAALHTVHGTFQARQSELRLDPASGTISGEIVVDARSGHTGNGMRDRKMHNDVLESGQYPEISFRPDRALGAIAMQGKSSVKVHGIFRIHGVDREIEVPAEVEMSDSAWAANVHFTIPYAKWGMKNPSTLFLRVSDSVEIDIVAAGSIGQQGANSGAQ
jgi:polyisoprenoid-binding protein YceI